MLKKDYKISISIGVLLGVLILALLLSGWVSPHWTLGLQTDTVDVLDAVLNSHTQWISVQGVASTIWHGKDGDTQAYTTEFVFEQPGKAMVKLIDAPFFIDKTSWISDGEFIYDIDLEKDTYTKNLLPQFATDLSMLPSNVKETNSELIYLHPLTLLTPSPVAEYIFPHGFAQGKEGTVYKVVGQDEVSGRRTWVVSMETPFTSVTAWIDMERGVILKYVQETDDNLFLEFEILSIFFNETISKDTYELSEQYTLIEADN